MMKTNSETKNIGLYIHIPFCERKCNYCGFLSFDTADEEVITSYMDTLSQELKNWSKYFYDNGYKDKNKVVDTIFIGGGTPSFIDANYIEKLLNTIKSEFNVTKDAEITIESNPNSLTKEKLQKYLQIGINRLSMGVQSFDDDILKVMGRVHDKETAIKSYYLAREVGFKNINIDLIFAVPYQNMDIWEGTLEEVIYLKPDHISYYSLQIEENTKFYKDYKDEKLPFLEDNIMNIMYIKTTKILNNAGYVHYEISNMAKDGFQCRHNLKYWHMDEYIGVGLGASSYMGSKRFENPHTLKDYEDYVETMTPFLKNLFEGKITSESKEDEMATFVFTALRTKEGIDLKKFKDRFQIDFLEVYKDKIPYLRDEEQKGHLVITKNTITLTIDGILISNDIMCEFV